MKSKNNAPAPRGQDRPICHDCGLDTLTLGEWYSVKDEVWEQAWQGRPRPRRRLAPLPLFACLAGSGNEDADSLPDHEILCIGCLEQRIGRVLTASDFTVWPVNDPTKKSASARLRDRLTAAP